MEIPNKFAVEDAALRSAFIKCFNTEEGAIVLAHIKAIHEAPLVPMNGNTTESLWFREGARFLAHYINKMSKGEKNG